uniref:HTH OST-type domain-containing protein n=1 Tax=Elaeophora elaphi TaxID=1147741 RepID=A0A0R3S532_9BILA
MQRDLCFKSFSREKQSVVVFLALSVFEGVEEARMSTLEDLKIRIVALIGSAKNGCAGNDLCRMYKDMYGKDLHSEDYGFKDLKSFLGSPIMQGEGGIVHKNGLYFAAGDKNTSKMLCLIRNTRSRNTKPRMPTKSKGIELVNIESPLRMSSLIPMLLVVIGWVLLIVVGDSSCQLAAKLLYSSDRLRRVSYLMKTQLQFASYYFRHMGSSRAFENQQSGLAASFRALNNYQLMSTQRNYNYDDHSVPSTSGIQLQSYQNISKKSGIVKSQKGKKRLIKLIEQHGGEMSFSEMKSSYLRFFGIPLNNSEICRLFNAKEDGIRDLCLFFKTSLWDHVVVKKLAGDDFLIRVIDEDNTDDIEYFSSDDDMTHGSLLPAPVVGVVQRDVCHGSFGCNERRHDYENCFSRPTTSLSANTETTANSYFRDSRLPVPISDDRYEYWKGSILASTIRSRDDYLSYKVLGDKVLSFVRAKGSLKISDLSKILYEEDGRHVDPKKYPEGTWENVIRKLLSSGRHPELTIEDGMIGLRKGIQKSVFLSAHPLNDWTSRIQNENEQSMPLNFTDDSVPVAIIYDVLIEAGRPLSQKELLEKLSARGIKVNVCQLTVKLLTKFKDVFRCEFRLAGALISLAHGARRPEEPTISPFQSSFIESVKINTHVMSEYCSTAESADNIFKPVLLINMILIDESLDRFRIQASFRLRSFEPAYNSFEEKMRRHYLSYGQEKGYAIEKLIKDCTYAFHDTNDNQVYRVQYTGDGGQAGVVSVYLIDEMCYQDVAVNQLRKLTYDYAGPAYGVVANTATFTILPGREDEFREYFSLVRSKLLGDTKQDIQADVVSEPSKNLFELKQLYSEAHDNLNVPATFVRQCLIQMTSSKS